MSSTDPAPEPTMDEILASIRRIIADEPTGEQPGGNPAAPVQDMNVASDIANALGESASGTPAEEDEILDLSKDYVADKPVAGPPPVQSQAPTMPPPANVPGAPPASPGSFERPEAGSQFEPESQIVPPSAPPAGEVEPAPLPPGMTRGQANAPEPPISRPGEWGGPQNMGAAPPPPSPPQFESPPAGAPSHGPVPPGPPSADTSASQVPEVPEFGSERDELMQAPSSASFDSPEQVAPAQQTGFIPPMRDSGFLGSAGQPDVTFVTIDTGAPPSSEQTADPAGFDPQTFSSAETGPVPEEVEPEAAQDFGRREPFAEMDDGSGYASEARSEAMPAGEMRTEMEDHQEFSGEGLDSSEDQPVIQLGGPADERPGSIEPEQQEESLRDVAAGLSAAVGELNRFGEADSESDDEDHTDHHFMPSQAEETAEIEESSSEELPAVEQDFEVQEQTQSGESKSLEQSVKELLRPMLRDWLDNNMPKIVEGVVKEEMKSSKDG